MLAFLVQFKMIFSILLVASCVWLTACTAIPAGDPQLTQNTQLNLVDWHITGLWIVNCPVAWVKVTNYNAVPIKDVTFQYNTYAESGQPLDEGTFTIEGDVPPGTNKNFIELYLGIVSLYSEKLSVKLLSVSPG